MAEGAYSQRFRRLQKEHMDQFRKTRQNENEDLNMRTHRLHLETARRCRSMALKKKQHAQREERLRQVILERRRQEMQEVTDKFQRLGRRSSLSTTGEVQPRSGGTPTLDEALQVILGANHPSLAGNQPVVVGQSNTKQNRPISATLPSRVGQFDSSLTEEFLNTASPSQNIGMGHGSSLPPSGYPGRQLYSQRIERKPSINGAWKPGLGPATAMREDSIQSLASSKGLFEQRLNEHQRTLAAQQQAALQEIGNALYGKGNSVGVSGSNGNDNVGVIIENIEPNAEPMVEAPTAVAEDLPMNVSMHKSNNSLQYHGIPTGALHSLPGKPMMNTALSQPDLDRAIGVNSYRTDSTTSAALHNAALSRPDLDHAIGSNTYRTDTTTNGASQNGNSYERGNGILYSNLISNNTNIERGNSASANPNINNSASMAARLPDNTNSAADGGSLFAISAVGAGVASPSFFLHRTSSPVVAVVQPSVHPPVSDVVTANPVPPFVKKTSVDVGAKIANEFPRHESHENSLGDRSKIFAMASNYQRVDTLLPAGNSVVSPSSTSAVVGYAALSLSPGSSAHGTVVPVNQSDVKSPAGWLVPDTKLDTKPPIVVNSKTSAKVKTGTDLVVSTKSDHAEHSQSAVSASEIPYNISGTRRREPVPLKDINCIEDIPIDDSSSVSSLLSDVPPVRPSPLAEPHNVKPLPKGILKKRPSSVPVSGHNAVVSNQRLGSGGLTRLGSTTSSDSNSLRDSLEVTKSHLLLSRQFVPQSAAELKSAKKSVRFAENLCEEAPPELMMSVHSVVPQTDVPASNLLFYPTPPAQEKPKGPASVGWRSTRPLSAKVVSSTPPVDPRIKAPRVASAGVLRRTSFARAGQPYSTNFISRNQNADNADGIAAGALSVVPPGGQSASGGSTQPRNDGSTVEREQDLKDRTMTEVASGGSVTSSMAMINGIHVDRTPTNEEIDWLWQKVRSCLSNSRSSTTTPATIAAPRSAGGPEGVVSVAPSMATASRIIQRPPEAGAPQPSVIGSQLSVNVPPQNAAVNGVSAPSLRQQPRVTTYVNNYMGSGLMTRPKQPRNVVTMETLSGLTRPPVSTVPIVAVGATETSFVDAQSTVVNVGSGSRLLAQRRILQQQQFPVSVQQSSNIFGRQTSVPSSGRVGQENRLQQSMAGVTESMAGFLAAEKLCQTELTESAVGRALSATEQTRQMHINSSGVAPRMIDNKAPSTLSLEEQRIIQSLERLDDKLKANEIAVSNITSGIIPRPPAFSAGFRGHQLRSGLPRRPVTYNGSVPRQYFQQQGNAPMPTHHGFIGQQQPIR